MNNYFFNRLARYWNNWKLLTFRKFFYLPHIVTTREKRFFAALALISIASGATFFGRIFYAVTNPAPKIGGTYAEGILKEPRAINPVLAVSDADRDLSRLVFSGLLAYDGNGALKTDLAERYEISEDAKSYTVTLKKNSVWHDGQPLDADDVIFTIQTIQNPAFKSPLRPNWQGVQIEKLDRFTLRFTLRAPYAPFIENLTVGIIPKHVWEKVSPEQAGLNEFNLKPVGSGPFQYDSLKQQPDGTLIWYQLTRNPRYYGTGPYISTVVFYFFPTEDDLIGAWRRGDIDGFGPVTPARIPELSRKNSVVLQIQVPRLFGIFFNDSKSKVLADRRVRQAILHALNKKEIAQTAVSGGATPLDSPLPWLGEETAVSSELSYNPDEAKQLLTQAGWVDQNGDGIREKKALLSSRNQKTTGAKNKKTLPSGQPAGAASKDPSVLRLTLTTSDWPDLLQTAEKIKEMLAKVGMEVQIEKKSFADLETTVIRPRNFEMLLFGQVYGYEPDPFAFWHSSQVKDPGLNVALYANRKADRLLEEARQTSNPAERNDILRQFSAIVSQDVPAVFLFSQLYFYLIPANIQGVNITKISLPANRFADISEWYLKTKRVLKR
ncbi:MAG: peptide ABC transporter substrate-binding protein [Candidatus Sungbacteria bacterium]|nr:peptide ABC transporter substrate-binding protein [Candidatus Sungbacteria bacterium]